MPRGLLAFSGVAVAIAIPLLVSRHTLPLTTFYGEWVAAVLWLAACVGLLFSAGRARSDGRGAPGRIGEPGPAAFPWAALAPLWLACVAVIQWAAGEPNPSGSRLLSLLALLLALLVTISAWRLRQQFRASGPACTDILATAMLAAALLGTLAQWVQVFDLEGETFGLVSNFFPTENRRLWGNLNQPNHQATVEGMGLAAAIWLAARGRLGAAWWLVAVAVLESGIVLSGSRTGLLHIGIASVLALLLAWFAGDARRLRGPPGALLRRPFGLVFAAAAMMAMLPLMQWTIGTAGRVFGWALFDAVARLQDGDQVSYRGAMWAHALAMFDAHPWLGVGWGEFGWHQFRQLAEVGVQVEMSLHAHNAVLDLLAKTGMAGTVGVAVVLLAWFARVCVHRLWRADPSTRMETTLCLAWLAMLGAHSMLEYPLHYLYFLLPACFLLGWLEPAGFRHAQRGRSVLPARAGMATLAIGAAWVLTTMWFDYRATEAREYAGTEARAGLAQPRYWFVQHAAANDAEQALLTVDNAAYWLPRHVAAVHLLPTPTLIARTAWLMALTGDEAGARDWVDRLRFYYFGDERNQLAMLARECGKVDAGSRPEAFCRWVREQDRTLPLRHG